MREDSPRWKQINASAYPWEQDGLRELASYLPDADPYHVWANVEFVGTDGSINEVDALVLTPSGLWVLELKHWHGEIRGDGAQWVRRAPNSRLIPEDNPYVLANRKAKRLASVIRYYARQQGRQDDTPYVGAAVFLHARGMRADLDALGGQHVYGLDGHDSGLPSLKTFLTAAPRNPAHLVGEERGRQIVELVRGAKIKPSVADRKVGQLLVHPKPFAEGLGWQDFLAGHTLDTSLVRRVRFYLTSRAAEHEVPSIRKAAEREFRLLQGIHHPGVAQAHDLVEHAWGPAVVFEHQEEWVRLDQWLLRRGDTLTLAQRLSLVQELAEIIHYAHSRRLVHRALSPRAIFVKDPDGSAPTLVVTDWQTGGRIPVTSLTRLGPSSDPASLELFFDDEVRRYQAPEAENAARLPGHQLDVFSLGALAYRIFAGRAPAATREELVNEVRDSGLRLDAAVDGMPDTLVTLVYDASRGDPAQRLSGASAFRSGLEKVWEELTAPDPEPVVDPLSAHRGDLLDGGLTVKDRLGSGATAVALLVTREGDSRDLVLKVARDEQHEERLTAEARTLGGLKHHQVAALVDGPVRVGGRTALLMESAGPRTLAEELRGGRLALDLLERYGRDLLDIVNYLDGQGVWHRDLKPANLAARPRPKDKQQHLCVFDFSLSATPADQIAAGTVGYLDPFLGPPRRLRYDAAAERFAAAVVLYEMATGSLPRWGDNANPAAISGEVTLDPAVFDAAVADRLVEFFRRALARDAAARFDTVDEMTDTWRAIFQQVPQPAVTPVGPVPPVVGVTVESPLTATDLTARARSALERLGLHTVGELLDAEPSALTRAKGVPDATRKEILAQARALRAMLVVEDGGPAPVDDQPQGQGVEKLCASLLPAPSSRHHRTIAVLLGQAPTAEGRFLSWPAQTDAAKATDRSQPQISKLLATWSKTWLANPGVTAVRDEIVALLDTRGAVMSAEELARALIAVRGSYTSGPKRLPQAIGLVRAAVEAELSTGGDSRVDLYRCRPSGVVLVGREPDDPTAEFTAADFLGYVVELGNRATELAGADPLPSPQRVVEELRRLEPPEGMPTLPDLRLVQLAAVGSNDRVDLNAQGQLYPVDMPAKRALELSIGTLTGHKLSPTRIQERVQGRFPRAQSIPGRTALDDLLREVKVPLTWHVDDRVYVPVIAETAATATATRMSTWTPTPHAPLLRRSAADEVAARLADTVDRNGFLTVLAPWHRLVESRRALLARFPLTEVDVTAILLDRLRAQGLPWDLIVAADNGQPLDPDFRSLVDLVRHHVVPAVDAAITAGTTW
ncbi:BREX system serine/threonine kinase PglW, partial [Micromonospora fluostatini]